jgi:hypothetical protein
MAHVGWLVETCVSVDLDARQGLKTKTAAAWGHRLDASQAFRFSPSDRLPSRL